MNNVRIITIIIMINMNYFWLHCCHLINIASPSCISLNTLNKIFIGLAIKAVLLI